MVIQAVLPKFPKEIAFEVADFLSTFQHADLLMRQAIAEAVVARDARSSKSQASNEVTARTSVSDDATSEVGNVYSWCLPNDPVMQCAVILAEGSMIEMFN